jgi:uncharacterized protein (TIGR02217 family)
MSTAVFPTLKGIDFPIVKSPMFSTISQMSASGKEARARLWTYPRWKWDVPFTWLRSDGAQDYQTLLAFWLARSGPYDPFLFYDLTDCAVAAQQIGIGNGTTAQFQMYRTLGGYAAPVFAPKTWVVKVNGVTKTDGVDYGVGSWENGTTPPGTVNFIAGHIPTAGQTVIVDITYYWPVNFMDDSQDFSQFMANIFEAQSIKFISNKGP